MTHTLRLLCNTCTEENSIDARTTLVMQGETARAVFWSCPACSATQWSTLPTSIREAVLRGARQSFGRVEFVVSTDGICGRASVVPLRELFTYPKSDGTLAIWKCRACREDRVSQAHPEAVYRIVAAGGTALTAEEGAMIELLATEDYQPHAAMQACGFPFHTTERTTRDDQ